jgi:hypothetical protein
VLDTFFHAVGQGPPAAEVTNVEKHERDVVEDESEFEVRRG